jgi:hypothetical protein
MRGIPEATANGRRGKRGLVPQARRPAAFGNHHGRGSRRARNARCRRAVSLPYSASHRCWPRRWPAAPTGSAPSARHGCRTERIPRHHDAVGHSAAALSASKAQVLQRTIAPPDSDDGPQVSGRLMVAGRAPDPFFARGRPWFAGWWRRQCFLVPNRPRVVAVPSRAYASFARQF